MLNLVSFLIVSSALLHQSKTIKYLFMKYLLFCVTLFITSAAFAQ
ncbi:MAG: hypothetical protein ACI849_001631, partial [Patiriisocius sp.]